MIIFIVAFFLLMSTFSFVPSLLGADGLLHPLIIKSSVTGQRFVAQPSLSLLPAHDTRGPIVIEPLFPVQEQEGALREGGYFNPYIARDRETGVTWEIRPTYPTQEQQGPFRPGGFANPLEIIETDD